MSRGGRDVPMEALRAIVADQVKRYPRMTVRDWYKLAHQATMGGAHAGLDPNRVLAAIQSEWRQDLKPLAVERLLEPIDPWGRVLRLNLRLLKKTGGTIQQAAQAFIDSWSHFTGDARRLVALGQALSELADEGVSPLPSNEIAAYWDLQARDNYPARSHSETYRTLYQPAYRIILAERWGLSPSGSPKENPNG